MTETQDLNLTIDILFNSQNKVTDDQNGEMKFCPVCQGLFPPTEILRHASLCADNKYQSELKFLGKLKSQKFYKDRTN